MKKISVIILMVTLIIGCSSGSYYKLNGVKSTNYRYKSQNESLYASSREMTEQMSEKEKRMVIYNASLDIVVKAPDTTNLRLTEIANKYDGYVQILGNKKSVIRVKSEKLQYAMAEISLLGKLKNKSISGDDVTEQYTDIQIRLENAYKARNRYLELLAKAENVEAALKVEKELERLNIEIDTLEGKKNLILHLAEYSTITIFMEEKVKPGILGYIGIGLYKCVKWLFIRN